VDTPLHSLYVSSRPLDKSRNEDKIIILDIYQWHVYLHTLTHTNIQLNLITD